VTASAEFPRGPERPSGWLSADDIARVRDALRADFIVIGQVQTVDDRILVRTHLIRAADQVHVWVNAVRLTKDETTLLSDVSSQVAAAVSSRVQTK